MPEDAEPLLLCEAPVCEEESCCETEPVASDGAEDCVAFPVDSFLPFLEAFVLPEAVELSEAGDSSEFASSKADSAPNSFWISLLYPKENRRKEAY